MTASSCAAGNIRTEKRLTWLAHGCLMVAAIGLIFASLLRSNPELIPIDPGIFPFMHFSAQMSQVIYFGGVALAIALLAWISPAPAAILGILFGIYRIIKYSYFANISPQPITSAPGEIIMHSTPSGAHFMPQPIYYLLYGLFLAGCAIHLFLGVRNLWLNRKSAPEANTGLRLTARIVTLAALVISNIVFLTVDEASVAFNFNVLAIVAFGIAWFWHKTGSVLIILLSVWSLYDLLSRGYGTGTTLIYSSLFSLFLAGGVLYLLFVLQRKPVPCNEPDGA